MIARDDLKQSFPIVGIGASAGGLEALQSFLDAIPKEFNFALVFVQHLSRKHKSLLQELLSAKRPSLVIQEISDGLKVQTGRLYLAPPGQEVRLRNGLFQTTVHPEGLIHLPIDEFLASLAEDAGERAIAVIFSGAGTDGARGCREVRASGGTIYAQDPETAEFDSMPVAAIATGQADAILSPEGIARELLKIEGIAADAARSLEVITPEEYDAFFRILLEKTGARFNHYKKSVVGRRIRRRMYLQGASAVRDYLDLISTRDTEAASLASDLMIGVTSFFRDRLAWKVLNNEVVRKLTAENVNSPVRVWTPATATGEEAYSIAIMLSHELALAGKKRDIQVFATDMNDRALEQAREGRYPESISADVPGEYLQKYFMSSENSQMFVVTKEIRERVVFAKQDLLTDPPFSRLDLIICRNFMIYLEPEAQEKCITLFHYALKQGGYLFLGNAETVGRKNALFQAVGRKQCRVYRKVETTPASRLPLSVPYAAERAATPATQPAAVAERQLATSYAQEFLLEEYAPASIAIDQNYDIVYHNGPTNRYLRQPRGVPTQNALELLPEALRNRIRGAIFRAGREAKTVSIPAIFPVNGDNPPLPSASGRGGKSGSLLPKKQRAGLKAKREVTLRISKVIENLFVIVFQEKSGSLKQTEAVPLEAACVEETAMHQLENELSSTRQDLHSHIEQLKSLNEELQSSNEEFQAANEELETSREELQSLNEELVTVNSQLQAKIEEQDETNNDLNNFLASTNIPTVFLDQQIRVKRFTPAMSKLLKLIPTDVGRPIIDMSQEGLGPELIIDAQTVLDSLVPIRKEMLIAGVWFIRAVLPYRTGDNRIEGVVVTYNDVTELKVAEERTKHLASFPQLNPNAILEVTASGAIVFTNAATQKVLENLGMDKDDATVFLPHDMDGILRELEKKEELSLYREVIVKDKVFGETVYLTPQVGVARIYTFDITERKRAERVLEARLRLAEVSYTSAKSADEVLRLTLDELEAQTGSKIGFYHFLEEDQETLSLQNWSSNTVATMCTAEGSGSHYNISQAGVWVDCVREKKPVIHNDYTSLLHKKGMPKGHAPVSREMLVPIFRGGRIVAIIGVGNKETDYTASDVEIAKLLGDFSWEIIERKRAEDALKESEQRYHSLFNNMVEGFAYCKMLYDSDGQPMDFVYLEVNSSFGRLTGLSNVVGKKVSEVIPGIREADPELFGIYGRVAKTCKPERLEFYVEALKMWFSLSVYCPQIEYFVAVFDVITERKKSEQKILKLSEDMVVRNLDLEDKNKELEAFVYSISHDLRAPLRSMSGFSKNVMEDYAGKLDERGKDYLARIRNSSERMTRLIDDLLRLSKISRQEIDRMDYDLSKLAESVVHNLRESSPGSNIEVVIREGIRASADPNLMRVVMTNLLDNAWKFTEKTENARVEFGSHEKDGKPVYFVKDNGAGFDQKYAYKMFWPFHRLHGEKEFAGTGIGLAIVDRIIRRHGGKVWAEGEVGKGATVFFTLG